MGEIKITKETLVFFKEFQGSKKDYSIFLKKEDESIKHGLKEINLKKSSLIIDIGCGDGRFSGYLTDLGYYVFGIDCRKETIEEAIKKYSTIPFKVLNFFSDTQNSLKILDSIPLSNKNFTFLFIRISNNFFPKNLIYNWDFCLKLLDMGRIIIYPPHAEQNKTDLRIRDDMSIKKKMQEELMNYKNELEVVDYNNGFYEIKKKF